MPLSSTLAVVTTIHLALAALCNHRHASTGPVSTLAVVSLIQAGGPWVFPTREALVAGLMVHGLWIIVCEIFARPRLPAVAPPPPSAQPPPPSTPMSRPVGFVQVPILAAFDETPDIKTIRIARPDGFDFEAGQFLTLRVQVQGADFARCYSISSAPSTTGYLEISVKRLGVVSSALHAIARPGATLSIKRPNGRFKYPARDDRPIVLLAGGVGITPLMSMLRHAIHAEPARPVTLLYAAQTERDFAFRDELMSVARRHPQARVFFVASREPSPSPAIYPGRIDETLLRATVPDLPDSMSFVCGPTAMIDGTTALLASLGVPRGQIHHEVFSAAVAAASPPPDTPRSGTSTNEMRCTVSQKTVTVGAGQTLLEAAEQAGIDVPYLCRSGVCGTCRVHVLEGEVECPSTTLDEADRRDGFVLACVSTAHSSCALEL